MLFAFAGFLLPKRQEKAAPFGAAEKHV